MSVVVLDFGSQYAWLIVRRVRELGARAVVLPGDSPARDVLEHGPRALILSGGPAGVDDPSAPRPDPALFGCGIPILGICYGMQLLARQFGGRVTPGAQREYGRSQLVRYEGPLFAGVSGTPAVWMSHSDAVTSPPPGWRVLAATEGNPVAAIAAPDGRTLGIQFHPEVVHTEPGREILGNFLTLAGVPRDWFPAQTVEERISQVRSEVGGSGVLVGVSGGVDSSALALLLARAGVPHVAVFVDHGLLRRGEREEVEAALRELGVRLVVVDARDRFLHALQGVADPEEKRKVIGREFIGAFREGADTHGPFEYLAQGTLYPDVIESAGTVHAAAIKTHHNVGGLPKELGFKLLEPFRDLFKDEVREVARALGLPDPIRLRHPFPGPGLAVRIVGEVTRARLDILRSADAIFTQALTDHGLYPQVWQALAVLIPVQTVGVTGDRRHSGMVLALRAVTSADGMTADWARLPHSFLDEVATRITREVPEIGRVVYDVTSKPPATVEWE